MRRMQIAAVGLAVFAFGTMSWVATAFVPMLEQAPPQKVAKEGGCVFPIVSPDGAWSACVDAFGQVVNFSTGGGLDQVFETLLYEASSPGSGLTRRVEATYVVAAGPIVSAAGDSTWTRLTKANGVPLSIEITNRMINGAIGGVQIQVRCENKGDQPIQCKLFYYCDFDITPLAFDDEAIPVFDPGTGRLNGIRQDNFARPFAPLTFGGCPNYKSWVIDVFPALRNALDSGVQQLTSADATPPGASDHTCALASDEVFLDGGQTSTFEVGIGPAFAKCKSKCPYDCDGSNDGVVGINDFLTLLAQWGIPGATCDKTSGDPGVGINDFLALLANWGPCPVNSVMCCLPIDLEAYCQDPTSDPPEACVEAASCTDCEAAGGLCVEECNLFEQTITVIDQASPGGGFKHSTWTALVCAPKAPCVCGNLIDARFTPATPCGPGDCGDCNQPDPGGNPGCSDPACQAIVCAVDPFCCDIAWGGLCADLAADICGCGVQGSHVRFGSPEIAPIPADFFFPGSPPFVGEICLKGEPLGATPFGTFEVADTLIMREVDPFPCDAPFPASVVVPIEIVALSLVSIDPIAVGPTQWDVFVTLSQQVPQQQGIMEVVLEHANGGIFFSELPVTPLLIFTEVGNPGNVLQLDLGLIAPPIQLSNGNNPTSWVQDVKLGTLAPEGPPSCFNPGIKEDNP